MSSANAVQVTKVSKSFGITQALTNVSLDVADGVSLALLGRNGAGKSTLVSIITGLLTPDSGEVLIGGDASTGGRGVGCVYQSSSLVGGLTAAENIFLHRYPRSRLGAIDWGQLRRGGREYLAEWGCEEISDTLVEELAPVDSKIVEICRVLAQDPHVLLLDEPTAGLDFAGTQRLFERIKSARERGVAIIYVSHHLQEVFEVCDRAAVLRDGEVVLERDLSSLSVGEIVDAMVGEVQAAHVPSPPPPISAAEPLLTVDGMSLESRFEDLSFSVRPGECLGITGLDGAGQVEIANSLCGLERHTTGSAAVAGTKLALGNVSKCIRAGIGFVPEDRHHGGYVPAFSVAENATLPIVHRIANAARLISAKARVKSYTGLAKEWDIKAWGPDQPTEELSGGNQQKVVMARALSSGPSVLVLINPTRGVDVAAKRSIYATVRRLAEEGMGVIIVSSDDEDFSFCHRVLVMFGGSVHKELNHPFTDVDLALSIQGH